ncbi:hypothetical protein B0H21DRAFT_749663 [Amylocystis lapponica]|nr:hypothetical protein B0H21DRAFT_749663 [Amylocystis lapponica]
MAHPDGPECGVYLTTCDPWSNHDDHRDVHIISLRLALGSIVSPVKAPPIHPVIDEHIRNCKPFPPYSTATPTRSPPEVNTGVHAHAPSHRSSRAPTAYPQTEAPNSEAQSPTSSAGSPGSARPPNASGTSTGNVTSTRTDFIGTLRSKSAWDAMIHGSFV